jgi:hypothetical protein
MVKKKQTLVAQTAKDNGENLEAQKKKQEKETIYLNRF